MKAVMTWFPGMVLALCSVLALAGPVDEAIAARLQPLLQRPLALALTGTSLPKAVAEFYAARHWQPVWDEERLPVLLDELAELYTDGLNPEDYAFSRRWLALGEDIWLVPDLQLDHHSADQSYPGNFHRFLLEAA